MNVHTLSVIFMMPVRIDTLENSTALNISIFSENSFWMLLNKLWSNPVLKRNGSLISNKERTSVPFAWNINAVKNAKNPHFMHFQTTKLHNCTKLRMLFPAVLRNFPNSKVCLIGESSTTLNIWYKKNMPSFMLCPLLKELNTLVYSSIDFVVDFFVGCMSIC
jgi:hypothetical protein